MNTDQQPDPAPADDFDRRLASAELRILARRLALLPRSGRRVPPRPSLGDIEEAWT